MTMVMMTTVVIKLLFMLETCLVFALIQFLLKKMQYLMYGRYDNETSRTAN